MALILCMRVFVVGYGDGDAASADDDHEVYVLELYFMVL